MRFFWPCLYGLLACIAYAVRVNLHGRKLFLASLGGALGWFTYLMFGFTGYELVQYFMSAVAISIYAEIMARVNKAPVTGFLLVSMLPMVPGGGIYHTMESAVAGNVDQFIRRGLYTFAIAGALAIGVLVVSSIMHLSQAITTRRLENRRAILEAQQAASRAADEAAIRQMHREERLAMQEQRKALEKFIEPDGKSREDDSKPDQP